MIAKRLLQIAVALGGFVPVLAGLAGIIMGPGMIVGVDEAPFAMDSHFRYLSGLLLGVGLGYWMTIPHIEYKGNLFRLLTFIVVVGGLARMVSLITVGMPGPSMTLALVMELVVTPVLAFWQFSIEQKAPQRRAVKEN